MDKITELRAAVRRDQRASQAAEDERLLLSLALADEGLVLEVLALCPPEDLARPEHRRLLELIAHRIAEQEPVDLRSLGDVILREGPDRFGGLAYVLELAEVAPSTRLAIEPIAARIRDRSRRRLMAELGHALVKAARHEPATFDGEALPDDSEAVASNAAQWLMYMIRPAQQRTFTIGESVNRALHERDQRRESGGPQALPTSLPELDTQLSGGMRPGEIIVIGGRPGWGKTALALGIVTELAQLGYRCGYISLEMDDKPLSDRVLSRLSRVPFSDLRAGELDRDMAVVQWRESLQDWPLWLHWQPGCTVADVWAVANRWRARGLSCLVLDYIQRMEHGDADSYANAVGRTSRALKSMAMALEVPIIVLAQLNRDIERRQSSRPPKRQNHGWWHDIALPRQSDLRDSGALEADADVVLYPIHGGAFGLEADRNNGAVVLAKNRNGPGGAVVPARWDGRTVSYRPVRGSAP